MTPHPHPRPRVARRARALTAQESPSSREGSARTQPRSWASASRAPPSPRSAPPIPPWERIHHIKRGEGALGKPDEVPPSARTGPRQSQGMVPSPPPSAPENRSPRRPAPRAGTARGAPARPSAYVRPAGGGAPTPQSARTAPAPRPASRPPSLPPLSPPPAPRTAGRPGPTGRPRPPRWAVASARSRPLPGGGAAHRASIRQRRGGGGRREEEAGFKRKAVTPHKRFL